MIKWDRTYRIVGSSEPGWIIENLFLDSLLFLRALPADVRSLVDIGSGAGVPGIPISIVKPEVRPLLLVESRRRRASFLSTVVRELNLEGVVVLGERIASAPAPWRRALDAAVARCAGQTTAVVSLAEEFVRKGGVVVVSGSPHRGSARAGRDVVVTKGTTRARRFIVFGPAPNPERGAD